MEFSARILLGHTTLFIGLEASILFVKDGDNAIPANLAALMEEVGKFGRRESTLGVNWPVYRSSIVECVLPVSHSSYLES